MAKTSFPSRSLLGNLKAIRLGKAVVGAARKFGDFASKATGVERKLTSRVLSAGLSGASGATVGAAGGAATGFVTGMISDGWSGAWDGALSGAQFGAIQGGIGGALRGFVNPYICFVAGTQVVIDVEGECVPDAYEAQTSDIRSNAIDTAPAIDSALAVATQRRYVTMPIEELVSRGGGEMGDGGGQTLLTRDQHDPDGPLVRRRIVRTYERIAYHLQILTLRDEQGVEQTLRVTDEHPFYRVSDANWTPAKSLMPGEAVRGDRGLLTVLANVGEDHPVGIKVYNLEVEQTHTYFVLAERAETGIDAVWVHNATYPGRTGKQARLRELAIDPMVSSADRGWIKQEMNQIARGHRRSIRLPGSSKVRVVGGRVYGGRSGMVLAHPRGKEARLGFGYEHAVLQDIEVHKIQHKYEGYR